MIHCQIQAKQIPKMLKQMPVPPKKLFFSGPSFFDRPLISVVGAREMRPWLANWFENELLPVLASLKVDVVSGGARGVDQWAHRIALRSGQKTWAVLPAGLHQIYPKSLGLLMTYDNFHLISEYPLDQDMRKHHFYRRNELIAALSPLTLVIQASVKSGTMITAQKALELGRTVAALPGAVDDSRFSGNNQLLFDGALLVRNRWDLAQLIEQVVLA